MIRIDRPNGNDVKAVSDFFNTLLNENFPIFNSEVIQAYTQNWKHDKLVLRIANKNELLEIVYEHDEMIGLIAGGAPEGGVGTIIWLIIKTEYQGRKLGQQLLNKARLHYINLNCHKIKLTAPTESARDFYLKQGMELEGFHKAHWYKLDFWAFGELLR